MKLSGMPILSHTTRSVIGKPDKIRKNAIIEHKTTPLNCHDCGLESFDDCEDNGKHVPANPKRFPCVWCTRNPELDDLPRLDWYNEAWVLDSKNRAFIEA